jgi:hypothetical protein
MPEPLSMDLRARIVAADACGQLTDGLHAKEGGRRLSRSRAIAARLISEGAAFATAPRRRR